MFVCVIHTVLCGGSLLASTITITANTRNIVLITRTYYASLSSCL